MSFAANVAGHSGGGMKAYTEVRKALGEIGVQTTNDPSGGMRAEYTPGSYDPIEVRFFFPDDVGVLGLEGQLFPLEEEPTEDLRLAVNLLNVEVATYRFYVGNSARGRMVFVRHDLLPNLDQAPPIHPRELRLALTGLCAQKAIFAETLQSIQEGRSWRLAKDALRAIR